MLERSDVCQSLKKPVCSLLWAFLKVDIDKEPTLFSTVTYLDNSETRRHCDHSIWYPLRRCSSPTLHVCTSRTLTLYRTISECRTYAPIPISERPHTCNSLT